ncbi:MAG: hypothetical protein H0T51_14710 [Pirellulales bacterium]|jgi:hypothetical protein|nr:hypothetical protein [Pirellulales bacterium]
MMDSKKPVPLMAEPRGSVCPVCGKRSYSLRGIHPQCAVQQADEPRQKLLAAEKKEKARLHAEELSDS